MAPALERMVQKFEPADHGGLDHHRSPALQIQLHQDIASGVIKHLAPDLIIPIGDTAFPKGRQDEAVVVKAKYPFIPAKNAQTPKKPRMIPIVA